MFFVLIFYVQSTQLDIEDSKNLISKNLLGNFVFIIVLLYIGLRPISGKYFVDMGTYAITFKDYAEGYDINKDKDVYFELFTQFCTKIMTVEFYFLVCAALYIVPLYYASKKLFNEYWFYGFFMLIISMSFWAYGTNGIRNGIATSFFLYAISRNTNLKMIPFIIIAIMAHKSLTITTLAYIISRFVKNTKFIIYFWLFTILLSLAFGAFFEGVFLNLGLGDEERIKGYFEDDEDLLEAVLKVGFRWDFIIYSASAVFTGWYFIFKKNYKDVFYTQLYNTFLITNAVWILVIKANYSNRFAYLSWFLMGFVIIYPLIKNKFFENQHQVVAKIIAAYFFLTFLLNVLLVKS